jgi:hypothetical protein
LLSLCNRLCLKIEDHSLELKSLDSLFKNLFMQSFCLINFPASNAAVKSVGLTH